MGGGNGHISLCSGGIDGCMVMALFYKREFWFGDGGYVLKRGHRGMVMAVEWQRGSADGCECTRKHTHTNVPLSS